MAAFSRRAFLRGTGMVGAAVAIPSAAVAQAPQPPPRSYRFFNADEAAFVEAAVDRLIPPDDHPGASEAGVPIYIDGQLDGAYGRGERMFLQGPWRQGTPEQGYQLGLSPAQLYRTSLQAIGRHLGERQLRFDGLSGDDQDTFLKELEGGALDFGGFSSAIFFETLLANTVEGFFADPVYGGNRDKAGWRMIGFPGAYAAYVTLYTRHGVRFDREPLAMDEITEAARHRLMGHSHP